MNKNNTPTYIIERWPHGWLVCGANPQHPGIPMDAMTEVTKLFGGKKSTALVEPGINRHFRVAKEKDAVLCLGTPAELRQWRDEITMEVSVFDPDSKWYFGCDVGMSSLSIFVVLAARKDMADRARNELNHRSTTPSDADDFGRCLRLVAANPTWRGRLDQVAAAHPDTAWPKIIERWDELAAAAPDQQSKILKEIHDRHQ